MPSKNTSDHIEDYIKELLTQSGFAEIKRSHIADTFQVVPSQINYVIKTRFTESRGYLVESKRGGGGYIRIVRLSFSDQHHLLRQLIEGLNQKVTEQFFSEMLTFLMEEKLMTVREAQLVMGLASDEILGDDAMTIRSRMLRKLLLRLDRKG